MRKKYLTSIVILLIAAAGYAQTSRLTGKIINEKNEPIEGATSATGWTRDSVTNWFLTPAFGNQIYNTNEEINLRRRLLTASLILPHNPGLHCWRAPLLQTPSWVMLSSKRQCSFVAPLAARERRMEIGGKDGRFLNNDYSITAENDEYNYSSFFFVSRVKPMVVPTSGLLLT